MTDNERQQIRNLRNAGISYARIAKAMELSVSTVKTYCTRNGLGGIAVPTQPEVNSKHFCQFCGSQIVQTPGRKEKRFCNSYCRNHYWNSHLDLVKRKAIYEYKCPACGKPFTAYGNSKRKFCSHECYVKARWGA